MHPKARQIIRDIKQVHIQGASQIRRAAVKALQTESRYSKAQTIKAFQKEIERTAIALVASRPTEPGLRTVVRIVLQGAFAFKTVARSKQFITKKCREYEQNRTKNLANIRCNAKKLLARKKVVLTHCHSHTVESILIGFRRKIDTVYCTETRPLFQGRITARKLSKAGLHVVQIVDSAACSVMPKCDLFITGADAVLANGGVVNKIGTAPLSLCAKHWRVPHYVATSRFSFDPLTFFGWPQPIEQRGAREVWPNRPRGVAVQNPAFDVTPSEIVKGIVCEWGIVTPRQFVRRSVADMQLVARQKDFLQWMHKMKKTNRK